MVVAYTVTLYTAVSSYVTTHDLSDDILSMPIFTDTGDGEINTATIRLTGKDGKYMTTSPIISDHDRVKLDVEDYNGLHYVRCFELMAKVPIRNKIEPPTAQIELAGIEICFQRIKASMNTFELSTRQLYQKLMDTYNENKTTQMPLVVFDVTNIPDIMSNLDWSSEDTILNRLNELVDSFGASGENNGILDYYDIYFTTTSPTSITIEMFSSGLGPNHDPATFGPELIVDPIEFEGKVEPSLVNSVGAWGSPVHGSLPTDYSRFVGRQTIMSENQGSKTNFPEWVSGGYYPPGSRVKYTVGTSGQDLVYKKENNNSNNLTLIPPSNSDWSAIETKDYYGGSGSGATATATVNASGVVTGVSVTNGGSNYSSNPTISFNGVGNGVYAHATVSSGVITSITVGSGGTGYTSAPTITIYNGIQYSPWTSNKPIAWTNGGAGTGLASGGPFHDSTVSGNITGRCFFDGNLIINDSEDAANGSSTKGLFRTWVDFECTTSVFTGSQLKYLYGNNSTTGIFKGLRVLVRVTSGSPGGSFSSDNNKIMEYNGTTWFQKYPDSTGMLVAVLDSIKVYKWSGSVWDDQDQVENSLDCFHPYSSVVSDVGVMLNPDLSKTLSRANRQYTGVNENSAVTVTYQWSITPLLAKWTYGDVMGDSTSSTMSTRRQFYSSGAFLNFRFPFPVNNTGISESVGQLYGGSYASDGTPAKVPYLDLNNSTYTHDGKLGYNEDSSEDLGEISSIDFFIKLNYSPPLSDSETGERKRWKESSRPFEQGNFPMQVFLIDGDDHVIVQDFNIEFNNTWQSISLPIGGFSLYKGRKPLRSTSTSWLFVVPPKDLEYIDVFNHRDVRMMCINTKDSYDSYSRYKPQGERFGGISKQPSLSKSIQLSIDGLRFNKPLFALTSVVSSGTETVKQADFLQRPNIFVYDQLEGDTIAELYKQKFPYEEYQLTTEADFETKYGTYFYARDDFINHTDIVDANGNRSDSGPANTVVLVAKHIEYSLTKPMKNIGGLIRKVRGVRRFE